MSKYQRASNNEIRQTIQPRIAPLAAAITGALATVSVSAATITVTSLDGGHSAGACTLRSALYASANESEFAQCGAGDPGADSIVFDSGLSGTITLDSGGSYASLLVYKSVLIDGDNRVTIEGDGADPVFDIDQGVAHFELSSLTIAGGGGARGGGLYSRGNSLTLDNVILENNTAEIAGAAVWHDTPGSGELTVTDSEISGNTVTGSDPYFYAAYAGGGIAAKMSQGGDIHISSTSFYANQIETGNVTGDAGGGGGLHLEIGEPGQILVEGSSFQQNVARDGRGGAMFAQLDYAEVSLDNNDFTYNSADRGGGALYLSEGSNGPQRAEITLAGNEFTNNDAGGYISNEDARGGAVSMLVAYGDDGTNAAPVKSVTFSGNNTFQSNAARGGGGALDLWLIDTVPATVTGALFSNNSTVSGHGGAIRLQTDESEVTVSNSSFEGNTALEQYSYDGPDFNNGGAIGAEMTGGGLTAYGVGFYANEVEYGGGGAIDLDATGSRLDLSYSTFTNNQADSDCGGGVRVSGTPSGIDIRESVFSGQDAYCGGAIAIESSSTDPVVAEIKYNEFSANRALSTDPAYGGGALFSDIASSNNYLYLTNSTVSGNQSDGVGGGISLRGGANAEILSTTIADNYAAGAGGGLYNSAANCSLENVIMAGNESYGTPQDIDGPEDCGVAYSLLAAAKYSSYSDDGGNIANTDPQLEPLADNGGNAGRTHALDPASAAIDAGTTGGNVSTYDQRGPGFPRVVGAALDMGAYESASQEDGIFQDRFEQP